MCIQFDFIRAKYERHKLFRRRRRDVHRNFLRQRISHIISALQCFEQNKTFEMPIYVLVQIDSIPEMVKTCNETNHQCFGMPGSPNKSCVTSATCHTLLHVEKLPPDKATRKPGTISD